jgi:hypothetical protein
LSDRDDLEFSTSLLLIAVHAVFLDQSDRFNELLNSFIANLATNSFASLVAA